MSESALNGDKDRESEPNMRIDIDGDTNVSASEETEDPSSCTCPLFMDGLPRDFASNPALAALASLLADEQVKEDTGERAVHDITANITLPVGGGKITVRRQGKHNFTCERNKPYDCKISERKKPIAPASTTVPEAQLFLSLWKL